jgi:N-acetylglucosamine-6-phosphate deacetylase
MLTDPRPLVGFIADGVHTHQSIIELVWKALGSARLSLVTDAMAALGMPPGWHRLGDYDVQVDATSARLDARTLAGSILSLDRALRNVMRITGCSLEAVLPTLTTNNARAIGLGHERGRIAGGFVADLVVLSPDFEVYSTVAAGQVAYTAGAAA